MVQRVQLTDDELGALFTRAQTGDPIAMADALDALEPRIRAICRRNEQQLKRDRALTSDDLAQQGRLTAMRALLTWVESDIPPGAWVTVRLRSGLRDWVKRAGDRNSSAMSLDESVGERGEPAGQVLPSLGFTENPDVEELELEGLLARIPQAAAGAGDDFLALRLHPGTPNPLPDDQTLARLAQMGKTAAELGQMFGVTARAIKTRLVKIRKSGTSVPRLKRPHKPRGAMHQVPWPEKLTIIKEYLDSHPAVSMARTKKALGISDATFHKARMELAQMAG